MFCSSQNSKIFSHLSCCFSFMFFPTDSEVPETSWSSYRANFFQRVTDRQAVRRPSTMLGVPSGASACLIVRSSRAVSNSKTWLRPLRGLWGHDTSSLGWERWDLYGIYMGFIWDLYGIDRIFRRADWKIKNHWLSKWLCSKPDGIADAESCGNLDGDDDDDEEEEDDDDHDHDDVHTYIDVYTCIHI